MYTRVSELKTRVLRCSTLRLLSENSCGNGLVWKTTGAVDMEIVLRLAGSNDRIELIGRRGKSISLPDRDGSRRRSEGRNFSGGRAAGTLRRAGRYSRIMRRRRNVLFSTSSSRARKRFMIARRTYRDIECAPPRFLKRLRMLSSRRYSVLRKVAASDGVLSAVVAKSRRQRRQKESVLLFLANVQFGRCSLH